MSNSGPSQIVEVYTGDIYSIMLQIRAALVVNNRFALTGVSLLSAPGQVPGPGLACLCVWTKEDDEHDS
jgi:hypothetical protein